MKHTAANLEGVNGAKYYVACDTESARAVRMSFKEAANVVWDDYGTARYIAIFDANGDRVAEVKRDEEDPNLWEDMF